MMSVEVIVDFNMLNVLMKDIIVGNVNSTLIVIVDMVLVV